MNETASLAIAAPADLQADLLVVGCFENEDPFTDGFPSSLSQPLERLASRPGWKARKNRYAENSVGPEAPELAAVALRGLGKREDLNRFQLDRWISSTVDAALASGIERLALSLPAHAEVEGAEGAERVLRQLVTATYRYRSFLGEEDSEGRLRTVQLLPPPGHQGSYAEALSHVTAVAGGVELSRELGNSPGNVAHPGWMEDQARELAERAGIAMTVFDVEELERRGMNGLLAVGGGSVHPPRLVRLEVGEEGPIVAVVGKGITFDTGGISIKPAAAMEEMKYDKCGACTALGVLSAVAELRLPIRLRVYLALAENMPDGKAYRPGDIIRCYNGKSVEIVNTDAEGRIVLADALAFAAEEGPDWMVEFSTLTGACVVALGHVAAGMFTPSDRLAERLLAAAERCGERLWRMPLWPEFLEPMRSAHAELKNAGGRWGGANTAAAFLGQFVGEVEHWAHLDIAGPSSLTNKKNGGAQGATGYGVAFTVDWLRSLTRE